MKNRTAYIIKSNFSFYEKLFLNYGINKKFEFLQSETCINDLICSNLSDINIFNGRFHLAGYLQWTDFYPQNRDDGKYNIPGFAKVRTKDEFNEYGSIEKALEANNIKYKKIERPYINCIGEIKYSSKSEFHQCFNTQYIKRRKLYVASKITKSIDSDVYGLTKNQSHSNIPLFIGKNLKVDILYDRLKNKMIVGGKIINLNHRLKINIRPFGLLTISITYSITSSKYINSKDLIAIQKIIERKNPIIYKKKRFNDFDSFKEYLKSKFENSVFKEVGKKESTNLGDTTTLNFSNPHNKTPPMKEIIGVLDMDFNYESYSNLYKDSYRSKFGKYENDITIFKNDRLVYIFDEKWRYMRAKTLFYWAYSDIFSSIYINRKLLNIFSRKAQNILEEPRILDNNEIAFMNSLNKFILNFEQYKKLPRPLRVLFYNLSEELNYDYKKEISLLRNTIKCFKIETQKEHFIDYFTINPNFMGLGIDFNKIFKKINIKRK